MKHHRLVVSLTLLTPTLFAQEHTIAIKPQGDSPTRYTIQSGSKIETSMKTLVNGEEGNFGRGGGGGGRGRGAPTGPTELTQKVVFVDGGSWREYQTAEAKITRPGWDGESSENAVTGELQGKKVSLGAEPAVMGADDKTTPLPANAVRGLPRKIDLSGLAPSKPLSVGGTYEIGASFKDAIASLSHPVRAARGGGDGQGGQGRRARNRDEGDEEGAGGAAAGGRQRGQRGQRGGFGGMGGTDNLALQILAAEGTQPKLTGKLVKVENDLATIEISGEVAGKGAPDKLGLGGGMGMFGGRGGRGGRGGQGGGAADDAGKSEGEVKVSVRGTMVVDVKANALRSLDLQGNVDGKSHTERSMETRDGDTMDIETDATQKGDFTVKVACEAAK